MTKENKPASTLALFTVLIVINSAGILYVDDDKLCERNYLGLRQISTKINNAPAIAGW